MLKLSHLKLVAFEGNFDEIISIACAISLAAKDLGLIRIVPSSFSETIFDFEDKYIKLNTTKWDDFLSKKKKLDDNRRQQLISKFDTYVKIVKNSDSSIWQWLCHGHIGMELIWSAFKKCIISVCEKHSIPKPRKQIRPIQKTDRFIKFTLNWYNKLRASNIYTDTPIECFEMFNKI